MKLKNTRLILITMAATAGLIAVLGALTGALILYSGWYNVGATVQHWQPVYTLLERGMHNSVRHHARNIRAPDLAAPQMISQGATIYRERCVQCHGAPGVAQADIGKSMQPAPGSLVDAARRWKASEMYWITRHGIKLSGMPAWEFRISDEDIWAVVAFVATLPALSPQAYSELEAQGQRQHGRADVAMKGDPVRGRLALGQYACQSCHTIPGVTGSDVHVGPPLAGLAGRRHIARSLPNTPENLARWIRDPKGVDPHTAMPMLGVSDADARDMTAYLLALPAKGR